LTLASIALQTLSSILTNISREVRLNSGDCDVGVGRRAWRA
jgi:hypothetical protein